MIRNDDQTIEGLRNKDSESYSILYRFYYPMVESFVLKNNGSIHDAEDIFQETIIVLLEKVPLDDFELTSSLKTYLYSISSNLWLKRLREAKRMLNIEVTQVMDELHGTGNTGQHEQARKVNTLMSKISAHCQRLLNMIFYRNKNMKEIVEEQGYSNIHTAQNQKYKCIQQLKKEAEKK